MPVMMEGKVGLCVDDPVMDDLDCASQGGRRTAVEYGEGMRF